MDEDEREEMARGRSLESKFWSLESSDRAKLVSILSSISSLSSSDFAAIDDDGDGDGDGDGDAIDDLRFFLLAFSLSTLQ